MIDLDVLLLCRDTTCTTDRFTREEIRCIELQLQLHIHVAFNSFVLPRVHLAVYFPKHSIRALEIEIGGWNNVRGVRRVR